MISILKKAIPVVASVLLLAGSPAFAASHHAMIGGLTDDLLPPHSYVNDTPVRSNICASPLVIDKYAQSTEPPAGCPGDSGPYR